MLNNIMINEARNGTSILLILEMLSLCHVNIKLMVMYTPLQLRNVSVLTLW